MHPPAPGSTAAPSPHSDSSAQSAGSTPAESLPAEAPPAALLPVVRRLSGWGNLRQETCQVALPAHAEEITALLAGRDPRTWIARGLGRAYGDAAVNGGAGVIETSALEHTLWLDVSTGLVQCGGSLPLSMLIDHAVPRGYFLPVTPGTRWVTVGGAVAADVHGKNHHRDGNLSEFLLDVTLLTAAGEVLVCSRTEHPDIFSATIGGMGLTGVILAARIKLLPIESAWVEVDYFKAHSLDETLDLLATCGDQYRYSIGWIDCLAGGGRLGRSVLMQGEHAPLDRLPAAARANPLEMVAPRRWSVPMACPSMLLNRWSVRAFNAVCFRRQPSGRRLLSLDAYFYPLDGVQHWNRLYGRRGFAQYQAWLPHDSSQRGLVRLLEILSRSGLASFLAGIKSSGRAGGGLLSFLEPGHTLALDIPHRRGLEALVEQLDRVVLDVGGRLYLAKDALMSPGTFRATYPQLESFREVKARIDPEHRWSSSLARRLEICP